MLEMLRRIRAITDSPEETQSLLLCGVLGMPVGPP